MTSSATSSKSSSASSSSDSHRSLPRPFWFGAALLLFLFSSWIAFHQEPALDAYRQTSPLHADWWRTPVEFNAPQRLPQVWADFNDVFALKGTGHVWAVGSGGLILHSADYGRHWSRQYLVNPNDPAADKPINAPPPPTTPSKGAKAAGLRPESTSLWRRLTPTPLESAVLLGLAVKSGPPPEPLNPSQMPSDSKLQGTPPSTVLGPNSGVSPDKINPAGVNSPGISPDNAQAQKPTGRTGKRAPNRTNQPANPAQAPLPSYPLSPTLPTSKAPELTLREIASSDLNSVHFLDAEHGWIAGDNGALLTTQDGGKSWRFKDIGEGSVNYRAILFTSRPNGFLTAVDGRAFITRDEGTHWMRVEGAAFSAQGFITAKVGDSMCFVAEDHDGFRCFSEDNNKGFRYLFTGLSLQ